MPRRRNPDTGELVDVPSYPIGGQMPARDAPKPHAGDAPDEPTTIFPASKPARTPPAREEQNKAIPLPAEMPGRAVPPKTEREPPSPVLPDDDPPSRLDVETDRSATPGIEVLQGGPVVGWVVVVDGPGKGQARALGYGVNSLGRGSAARVRLDFGDDRISRQTHAIVTYDPRGRKFYLQHGGSTNLTYLDDAPVLLPTILEGVRDFSIGATTLRFVPFCGPEFDWQDAGEA